TGAPGGDRHCGLEGAGADRRGDHPARPGAGVPAPDRQRAAGLAVRALLTMTAVDLRRRLRDKYVLIFSLAVPLALMTVLNLLLGGATEGELEPVDLAVSAPEHDELAEVLVLTLTD